MLFTTQEELEEKLKEEQPAPVEAPSAPSLLAPVMPLSPWEQAEEEYGTGEAMVRRLGNILTGGLFDSAIIPEMGSGSLDRYKKELAAYADQSKTYTMAQALAGIDPSEITPAHIALGNEYGGSAFGEYLTDQYAAQNAEVGTDHAVADLVGVPYAQWVRRSPEQKRADRIYYQSQNGDGTYLDAQLEAQGKLPEQLQAQQQAEAEGTGRGNEVTADRQMVTGIRRQIKGMDEGARMLSDVRELIATRQADPGKFATGMRNLFGVETYEDGRMSATAAQGVIDQLRDVTLGAISESELRLLLGGLLDPSRSPEANLGTIDTALERMASNRELAIDDARLAWDRLSGDENQADFLSQASEDDWYFSNLGEGKNFRPVPKADGSGEVSFTQFSERVQKNHKAQNPYAEPLTREQIIIGFSEYREKQEALWQAEQERKKAEAERVELAKKGLTETPLMMIEAGGQEPVQVQKPDYLR